MSSVTSPTRQRLGGPTPRPVPFGCWSSAPARPAYGFTISGTTLRPASFDDGVDVRTVAGRLGHRNASTTLNVYAHFAHDADQEAAAVLARLLDDGRVDGPRPRDV